MTTPSFDDLNLPLPSVQSQTSEEVRLLDGGMGDGYEQPVAEGVNNRRITWRAVWRRLSEADRNSLITFLRARNGTEGFLWTQPGDASPLKWTCRSWSPGKRERNGRHDVTATFVQDFRP